MYNHLSNYNFPRFDYLFYFKQLYKERGVKAFYQQLNRVHRRFYSRSLIKKFSPNGLGIEIGVGSKTIAPVKRTVLSDAYSSHGVDGSIAQVFFPGDQIPYSDHSFNFVMSEHVLEHITNPIKTLIEWIRILKTNGKIILFLAIKK